MKGFDAALDPLDRRLLGGALSQALVGDADRVRDGLAAFIAAHAPDELMITAQVHDHEARRESFRLTMEAHRSLAEAA